MMHCCKNVPLLIERDMHLSHYCAFAHERVKTANLRYASRVSVEVLLLLQ